MVSCYFLGDCLTLVLHFHCVLLVGDLVTMSNHRGFE